MITKAEMKTIMGLINRYEWRFSKTMPQWPHWYILEKNMKNKRDKKAYELLQTIILDEGTPDYWGKKKRMYLVLGEYKYWCFEGVINRAEPISSAEVIERGKNICLKNK